MKLKTLLLALIVACSFGIFANQANAQFNPLKQPCESANAKASPTCQQNGSQNGSTTDPTVKIIKSAANIIASVAGVAAVIIIVYSGFMFVTAGGAQPGQRSSDPNKIKSARAALTGAIIGLILVALAWTIITFVTDRLIST